MEDSGRRIALLDGTKVHIVKMHKKEQALL